MPARKLDLPILQIGHWPKPHNTQDPTRSKNHSLARESYSREKNRELHRESFCERYFVHIEKVFMTMFKRPIDPMIFLCSH